MKTLGVFLSDIHIPDNINLKSVFNYVKELHAVALEDNDKFLIVLGGDLIDAKELHGAESMRAESYKESWYKRDCDHIRYIFTELEAAAPNASYVYLEGNHEERYSRLVRKYPDIFGGKFNWIRDAVPKNLKGKVTYIPYGTYKSFFKLGDCLFMHGTMYPENHARKYALTHTPFKVVYGHLHHFQSYTTHSALPTLPPRYAVTGGCLCKLAPEWKKGAPHQWQNGFISFVSENGVTVPTVHLIERGKFFVGGKEYANE